VRSGHRTSDNPDPFRKAASGTIAGFTTWGNCDDDR
jgi:hypothetical protein